MGFFDNNANYGGGGYLRKEGDFFFVITSVEYAPKPNFDKYDIIVEVVAGPDIGKISKGVIGKADKYVTDNDRVLSGFSYSQIGAYVVGAGITDEVNALEKMTVGTIGKMLVGKTIKAHNQLTRKSKAAKEAGETTGLFYEIGEIYKRSEWKDEEIGTTESNGEFVSSEDPDFDLPF